MIHYAIEIAIFIVASAIIVSALPGSLACVAALGVSAYAAGYIHAAERPPFGKRR